MNKINENCEVYEMNLIEVEKYYGINLPDDILESIKQADILLVPEMNFRGIYRCFPEETVQFFEFLKAESSKENLEVEILSTDEDYKELQLHDDWVIVATVAIQSGLLPIMTNLISNYLFKIYEERKTKINTKVKIDVYKDDKMKKIYFEGGIDEFEKTMNIVNETIFKD